ncbi:hypothetical protein ACFWDI_05690 [Streptomyces sp. NPDC060064]
MLIARAGLVEPQLCSRGEFRVADHLGHGGARGMTGFLFALSFWLGAPV